MDEASSFPVQLSLRVAAVSVLVVAPLGTALAYRLVRGRSRWQGLWGGLVLLPLVLPPSVVGFLLVLLLGRRGLLGAWLEQALGMRVTFSPLAAVIASSVVSLPIMVKTAQAAMEQVPRELENVARVLGLPPLAVFLRVTLPSAWPGLLGAVVLTFARAIGEFGATLMLAGNIPGQTNTMPLEIFAAYQAGDDSKALFYVAVLCAISGAVVWLSSRLSPGRAAS